LEQGFDGLKDKQGLGLPQEIPPDERANVVVMACTTSSDGRMRWSVRKLAEVTGYGRNVPADTLARFSLGLLIRKLIGSGPPKGYFYLDSSQIFIFDWDRMVISMIFVEMKSEPGEKFIGAQITFEWC
jgi:hypothetical protein